MDSVVVLCYGLDLNKFLVKFVEDSGRIEFDENGKVLEFKQQECILKKTFKEGYLNADDQYHAMLMANMLINDLGEKVTAGIYSVAIRSDLL